MAAYTINGSLLAKFDTQVISDKFKKREFVVEVKDGNYPQYIKLQLTQAKTDMIDPYNIGDEIKVTFDLRGTRYEKNGTVGYITNLEAWRIENAGAGNGGTPFAQKDTEPTFVPDTAPPFGSDDFAGGDLPF